jgi:hypothetical protein
MKLWQCGHRNWADIPLLLPGNGWKSLDKGNM